ncbi:MAG TPA: hypothetical protein VMF89_31725, partial [Polyangiales bacterium]|nr:hypothetical protein [Polyangiales bacterium]
MSALFDESFDLALQLFKQLSHARSPSAEAQWLALSAAQKQPSLQGKAHTAAMTGGHTHRDLAAN